MLTSLMWEWPAWPQSCLWNIPVLVLILKPLETALAQQMLSALCPCLPGLTTSVCSNPESIARTCISLEAFPKVGNGSQKGWTVSTPQARTDRSQCINTPVPAPPEQGNCSHGFPESPGGNHCRSPQWQL